MKKHFNFKDEKLNDGFQIDMSQLTEEQRLHVLQMFDARGVRMASGDKIYLDGSRYIGYGYWKGETSVTLHDIESMPIIDYPTLARAAVQLEEYQGCVAVDSKSHIRLFEYALLIGLKINKERVDFDIQYGEDTLSQDAFIGSHRKLSPEDFEAKLRGISPLVRENRTTETERAKEAQPKPPKKYYKGNETGLIVEWIKDTDNYYFEGIVVDAGLTGYTIGSTQKKWSLETFSPYYYNPPSESEVNSNTECAKAIGTFEFIGQEASPAVEQPENDDLSAFSKEELIEEVLRLQVVARSFIDDLAKEWKENSGLRFKQLTTTYQPIFDKVKIKQLEQENTQLENQLKVSNDLNNDYRELNEKLKAELATLKQPIGNPEQLETVYDAKWLDSLVYDYGRYRYIDGNIGYPYNLNGQQAFFKFDPKTSANIVISALAKELNGEGKGEWAIRVTDEGNYYHSIYVGTGDKYGQPLFANGQKAIDILTKHFPEVLKKYFA